MKLMAKRLSPEEYKDLREAYYAKTGIDPWDRHLRLTGRARVERDKVLKLHYAANVTNTRRAIELLKVINLLSQLKR